MAFFLIIETSHIMCNRDTKHCCCNDASRASLANRYFATIMCCPNSFVCKVSTKFTKHLDSNSDQLDRRERGPQPSAVAYAKLRRRKLSRWKQVRQEQQKCQYGAGRHKSWCAMLLSLQELSIDNRVPYLGMKEKNVKKMSCFVVMFMSTSEKTTNQTATSNLPFSYPPYCLTHQDFWRPAPYRAPSIAQITPKVGATLGIRSVGVEEAYQSLLAKHQQGRTFNQTCWRSLSFSLDSTDTRLGYRWRWATMTDVLDKNESSTTHHEPAVGLSARIRGTSVPTFIKSTFDPKLRASLASYPHSIQLWPYGSGYVNR